MKHEFPRLELPSGSRRYISRAKSLHLCKQPLPKGTQMKLFGTTIVLAIAILLTACGSSNNNTNVNGNWTATLTDQNNNPVFGFTTSLTTNSDNSVTGTNVSFTTNNGCFANGATATGSLHPTRLLPGHPDTLLLSSGTGGPAVAGHLALRLA